MYPSVFSCALTPRSALTAVAGALLLAACATQPSGRPSGGPNASPNANGGPNGAASVNRGAGSLTGMFSRPVSLLFASMDSNGDGMTNREELSAGIVKEWGHMPAADNIGGIYFSQWGLRALGSTDSLPTFLSFDTDFNSVVSKAEFTERLTMEFERLDTDSNGQLMRSEMVFAVDAPLGGGQRGGAGAGPGGGGPGGQGGGGQGGGGQGGGMGGG